MLVRLAGIEPTTPWFVAKYSIQLSYSRSGKTKVYHRLFDRESRNFNQQALGLRPGQETNHTRYQFFILKFDCSAPSAQCPPCF